ncbi:hypothetical protein NQZ68_036989 [Dissostichus eleginoides]|nr:hypothetical protein NQZ68_036989 [Dissostichus eleginoides]
MSGKVEDQRQVRVLRDNVAECVAWKQQVAASKQSTEKPKDQHPDYNIVIKYKRGADNVVADVLSRG